MTRLLSEAVIRGQLRRLAAGVSRSRVLAAAAAALWLLAPFAAWRLGRSVGEILAASTVSLPVTRGLALGLALTFAAAGAAVAVSVPGRRGLGPEVAASPVSSAAAAVALALPVALGVAVLVGPTVAALAAATAATAPGGVAAAVPLAISSATAAAAGAAVAEAGLHVMRGVLRFRRVLTGALAGAAAAAAAVELPARALAAGGLVVALAIAGTGVAAAGAAAVWVGLAAERPDPRVARPRHARVAPSRRPSTATARAAFALLARPPELRAALVASALFGLLGLAVGRAAGAPASAALLLGGGGCAIAAALVPLSARGRIDAGTWVWRAGTRRLVAAAWALSSLGLVLLALFPVSLVALTRPHETAAAVVHVVAVAVAAWAAALAAGAVAPRRSRGAGDDALALGAFGVATVALGAAIAVAGPWLGRAGLPDAASAGLLLLSASVGSAVLLGATWGRA